MDKDVFKDGMQSLVDAFPRWSLNILEPRVMKLWFKYFTRFTNEQFLVAIDDYIINEPHAPSISVLVLKCKAISKDGKQRYLGTGVWVDV